MIKKIIKDKEFLNKTSEEIPFGSDLTELKKDLLDTLNNSLSGVGLAAPQIGILKKAFIVKYQGIIKFFANPEIIKFYGHDLTVGESCLSIPTFKPGGSLHPVRVTRKSNVVIEYYDENWKKHKLNVGDMPARIIQHEYDHLIGWLCSDRNYEQRNKNKIKTFEQFNYKNK